MTSRKRLREDAELGPDAKRLNMIPRGFLSATGRPIFVSEQALKVARSLWENEGLEDEKERESSYVADPGTCRLGSEESQEFEASVGDWMASLLNEP